ncbi:MAG TPA: sigma 54-interacting transcriptional regulator [Desulfomonilaceae bacterium]|nr:sigma 54-interacting transcriptional regulator [Desulfomonilaceae bacterium]
MPNPTPLQTAPPLQLDPFRGLDEQLRQSIWDEGTVKDYPAAAVIVDPGDRGDRIRFLLSGRAVVIRHEKEGLDVPIETILPGDLIGEISYLTGKASPLNSEVVAEGSCQVLEIPADAFEQILRTHPDASINVLRILARKVIKLDNSVYKYIRKKRALQNLISRQDHLFPDYFVSETVRRRMSRKLEALAQSQGPILVTGETGVGKEFMAHAIFEMSPHGKRIFLCLDLLRPLADAGITGDYCEIPDRPTDLTEEQTKLFFGSEHRNSEAGTIETPGYLELTEEGTLVVRGIEQLTAAMQLKLLETLQTGTFRRVGSETEQTADFRLIGTTNLDASEISAEKHPLLHWLLDHSLDIPPLRKRRKEIPTLVRHYVNKYCQELHKEISQLPKMTIKQLVTYSWPGNDRELATTLKRAVMLAEDGVLKPQDIYFDLRRIEGEGKINLLRVPALQAALKSPLFPAIFQSAAAPFFFILLVLLFLGPADPKVNMGGLFSWAVGWPTMIFGSFIWARFWCSLCPMGTLSHLAKRIVSLEIPLPPFLKQNSDWIIAGSALFIIWLETATDIRNSPFNTGLLLMSILFLAVIVSVLFEKQSWCRYLCPLGGMMGVFSKTSPFELRADRNVCASQCTSNECFTGTKDRPGCPFGQMMPTLRSNRFCKICASCVKNCPHGAINLNLRVPGREIWEIRQAGAVTAMLVISMYGGLLSDLLYKTAFYDMWSRNMDFLPPLLQFTAFFFLVVSVTNVLILAASTISTRLSKETVKENFARYGLALLPLVLTAYMAFHLYYLINLGVYFPIMLWEAFRFEIFRQLVITVPPSLTFFIQKLLIGLGIIGTLVLAYRLSTGKNRRLPSSLLEFIPHAISACIFGFVLVRALGLFFY